MHYLSKEFNRLIQYAKGLGIKVTFSKEKNSTASAAWTVDGEEIIIYNKSSKTPLQLIFDLIHELGHHKAWLASGRKGDLKTDKILDKEAAGLQLTEAQRKHIYEMEKADSEFQYQVHHEIGSKIPLWRLKVEIELDTWIYKHFWLKGDWPTAKDRKAKKTEFIRKYGKKR